MVGRLVLISLSMLYSPSQRDGMDWNLKLETGTLLSEHVRSDPGRQKSLVDSGPGPKEL